jgi:hypothetical protein
MRTSPRACLVARRSIRRSVSMPCVGSTTAEHRNLPGNACTISSNGSGLLASMVMMARSTPDSSIWRSRSGSGAGSKISCSRLK